MQMLIEISSSAFVASHVHVVARLLLRFSALSRSPACLLNLPVSLPACLSVCLQLLLSELVKTRSSLQIGVEACIFYFIFYFVNCVV